MSTSWTTARSTKSDVDGRVRRRPRSAADTVASPSAAAAGGTVVSIDVSRKLPLGSWTRSWWLVTTPTVWIRSIGVPSSAEVLVAVGRIGPEPGSERLEPRQRSVGETLEVARDAVRGAALVPDGYARRVEDHPELTVGWLGVVGEDVPAGRVRRRRRMVVMCGKSGGTHRIQYSSAAPPPVGVIVTTIASLASIVTRGVEQDRSADPAHRHGRAWHAADVHRHVVGRHARAVGDVVVLVGTERREHLVRPDLELACETRHAEPAEHVDDDVGALGGRHADPSRRRGAGRP